MDARFLAIKLDVTCYNEGMKVGKSAKAAERGKRPAGVFCITDFSSAIPFFTQNNIIYIYKSILTY